MSSWNRYNNAYLMSNPEIKKVLDEGILASIFLPILEKENITYHKQSLIIAFSDYFLDLITLEDIQEQLERNIPVEIIREILNQIDSLKLTCKETTAYENTATTPPPTVRAAIPQPIRTEQTEPANQQTSVADLSAEIAAAEEALHAVQPIRTMAHDMQITHAAQGEPVPEPQPAPKTSAATVAAESPAPTPPAASVAAAAADRVPTPAELIKPAADPNTLVADGAGNQVRNHDARWDSSQ